MDQLKFIERGAGISIEEVVRDHEFSMTMNHFHSDYELYFLMEGERYYFIDRETYHVKKGMAVLVGRQQIHKTSMASSSYHDRILLHMSKESMEPFMKQNGLMPLDDLFVEAGGIVRLPEPVWEQVKALLLQIRDELEAKQGKYQVMVKLKLAEILLFIYRCRETSIFKDEVKDSLTVQTARHQKVHEVADYLLYHCETEESLEEVARRFYISKSYLSRIFREITGFSVNEYRNITRIKKAQKLLKDSECSITEIAGMLGFDSVTYFERVFKKHADMTPYNYRKKSKMQEK